MTGTSSASVIYLAPGPSQAGIDAHKDFGTGSPELGPDEEEEQDKQTQTHRPLRPSGRAPAGENCSEIRFRGIAPLLRDRTV